MIIDCRICLPSGTTPADELIEYYQACKAQELPPQLITLSKKLDAELHEEQEQ